MQLGCGARQRRIWTAETERTSAIAEGIASDKDPTKSLLKSCGVPIPEGQIVNSPEEAWEAAAQDIGLPVVVKPSDGNHGRGVTLDLRKQEDIEAAYHVAYPEGSDVMVERFIPGDEHRLLVVGGKWWPPHAARWSASPATAAFHGHRTDRQPAQLRTHAAATRKNTPGDHRPGHRPRCSWNSSARTWTPTRCPPLAARWWCSATATWPVDCTDDVHPK